MQTWMVPRQPESLLKLSSWLRKELVADWLMMRQLVADWLILILRKIHWLLAWLWVCLHQLVTWWLNWTLADWTLTSSVNGNILAPNLCLLQNHSHTRFPSTTKKTVLWQHHNAETCANWWHYCWWRTKIGFKMQEATIRYEMLF